MYCELLTKIISEIEYAIKGMQQLLKTFIRNKITSIGGGTIKAMLELYREEGTYLKRYILKV